MPKRSNLVSGSVAAFVLFGVWLIVRSFPHRVFSETAYIHDLIWLDAWAAAFLIIAVVLRYSRYSVRTRVGLLLGSFGLFGCVSLALIFAGTPFFLNGLGGDQLFRTAMVLKFRENIWPGDFFYKGLPAFYPPVYYWCLGFAARLFSVEAFHAIKLGVMALYLVGPFLLYWLWRRMLAPLPAATVVVFTFLFASSGQAILMSAPHAFIGNAFFIPWWLHYVERVGARRTSRAFYLAGSVIGALLFMTYYMPFFIGALILLVRPIARGRLSRVIRAAPAFRWPAALGVLCISALLSSPYWGPLFWSMATVANDAAQQEWHHLGVTGIALKFFEFSWHGLVFLAGLLYLARRYRVPLYRGMLILLGSVIPILLIGSLLGAVDRPINLIKFREFIVVAGGPTVGLLLAPLLRLSSRRNLRLRWGAAAALVALMIFVSGLVDMGKNAGVREARTESIPDLVFSESQQREMRSSVFLTSHHTLYCFQPVYSFLFANQHYAHPAADYTERFHFLERLQEAPDSYLFYLCCRHNRFDAIDYYWPLPQGADLTIFANLSNYPDRYTSRTLVYPSKLTADPVLFERFSADGCWRLAECPADLQRRWSETSAAEIDRAKALQWAESIRRFLDSEGCRLMDNYVSR